jgi:bifunctional non-homologous end joining protein LigD
MYPLILNVDEIRRLNRDAANVRCCELKKHWAWSLHYDLRLEYGGWLISFVLVDGPSCYADERRLAIRMPDHDPKYLVSERIIPKGKPGAGPTIVWDKGAWIVAPGYEDIPACMRNGRLEFVFNNAKLRGKWVLQRRPGNAWRVENAEWDLIKQADEFARERSMPDICVTDPNSVVSGRTVDDPDVGKKKPVQSASMLLPLEYPETA